MYCKICSMIIASKILLVGVISFTSHTKLNNALYISINLEVDWKYPDVAQAWSWLNSFVGPVIFALVAISQLWKPKTKRKSISGSVINQKLPNRKLSPVNMQYLEVAPTQESK